jgi:hypothetical protein
MWMGASTTIEPCPMALGRGECIKCVEYKYVYFQQFGVADVPPVYLFIRWCYASASERQRTFLERSARIWFSN